MKIFDDMNIRVHNTPKVDESKRSWDDGTCKLICKDCH